MKEAKGSISIFTLVTLLFMIGFLIISYANIINNSKSLKEQFSLIKEIYYKSNDNASYTDVYTDLRKKNRQNLTAYVDNSNILELEKTFESKLVNYKIYGNSVQNGTPTPDSPVEIENVGTKSKNLINVQDFNVTYEGYYHNSSTGFLLQPNCTYTLSFNYKINSASENLGCSIGYGETYYAKDINYITTYLNQTSGRFVDTFTTPADIGNDKYLFVRFARTARTANVNVDFSSIQLETGSEATDYVPYGKYAVPIKVSGKNLFDISKATTFRDYKYSQEIKSYGSISDGVITSNIGAYSKYALLYDSKILLQEGTYTIQAKFMSDKESGNKGIALGMYDILNEKAYISFDTLSDYKTWETKTYKFSVSTPSEFAIIVQGTGEANDYTNLNLKIKDIQLENGDKATSYEQYKNEVVTQIYINEPLRKSGNYADYIDFKNGKVVRNIKSITFNRNRKLECDERWF